MISGRLYNVCDMFDFMHQIKMTYMLVIEEVIVFSICNKKRAPAKKFSIASQIIYFYSFMRHFYLKWLTVYLIHIWSILGFKPKTLCIISTMLYYCMVAICIAFWSCLSQKYLFLFWTVLMISAVVYLLVMRNHYNICSWTW